MGGRSPGKRRELSSVLEDALKVGKAGEVLEVFFFLRFSYMGGYNNIENLKVQFSKFKMDGNF